MESLTTTYRHLLAGPDPVGSVPAFLLAVTELLLVGGIVVWFAAQIAKMAIDGNQVGISSRNRLAIAWAAIIAGLVALVDVAVLLILDRVPAWSAVSPHLALAVVMGITAILSVFSIRADLRKYRIYVEQSRKQGLQ